MNNEELKKLLKQQNSENEYGVVDSTGEEVNPLSAHNHMRGIYNQEGIDDKGEILPTISKRLPRTDMIDDTPENKQILAEEDLARKKEAADAVLVNKYKRKITPVQVPGVIDEPSDTNPFASLRLRLRNNSSNMGVRD